MISHQTRKSKAESSPKAETKAAALPAVSTRPPAWVNGLPLQPKLTVNQPGDVYEQEADAVAEQVMRMPARAVSQRLQRCACGGAAGPDGECEQCKARRLALQRKGDSMGGSEAPQSVHQTLNRPGQPLDDSTRDFMESRFGSDFSGVRVHNDSQAAQSARDVSARAYTVGSDVVFGSGQYAPSTEGGKSLLAHELTHVVQQQDGTVALYSLSRTQRIGNLQREENENDDNYDQSSSMLPVTWKTGPLIGPPIELPEDEAADRVNAALDVMAGLTYVRRPSRSSSRVASTDITDENTQETGFLQAYPDHSLQRASGGGSPLSKIHGGVIGSVQVCWDCLTGEASLKGWIWAGVGYDSWIGWVGGYYFGEKTWWTGMLSKLFEPGTCDPKCDHKAHSGSDTETGWGIAGFPINIKPKERVRFSKAGFEAGALLTPHSLCDVDLEIIGLVNLLGYLGPVATVLTKAVDGINIVTKDAPHVSLEAGLDLSLTVHLCKGLNSLLVANRAGLCFGGFVGGGIGLSHTKEDNHGAG